MPQKIGLDGIDIKGNLFDPKSYKKSYKITPGEGEGTGGGNALTTSENGNINSQKNRKSSNVGPSINIDYIKVANRVPARLPTFE